MKYVILAALALGLGACSSGGKKSDGSNDSKKPAVTKSDSKKGGSGKQMKNSNSVVCTYDKIKREIAVVTKGENCSVEYTKDGTINEIATGSAGGTFCNEVQERVKNNLASAGYSCN